ncbi:isoprenylcysteine carboxylmethyltransferase family protein [Luteimonas sp. RC10]|uniref:isoprenylcysteine carboxylmethyltransferase family protein n=1 Tax=Luteimonas sp. RC10 TaxID=2587035 RepID=UPI00160DF954|nr:isoprenylcysteine carboxylmethyltransferase family protein [Luteimonas sp. RC10]MBB3345180.1 protein-S-isoprenylcysteine O-methyltransferase Ste14 [Luteimonas sp. RC10]
MTTPPPSTAVPLKVGLSGLIGFSVGILASLALNLGPISALAALILCTGAPMWWLEWQRHSPLTDPPVLTSEDARTRRRHRAAGLLALSAIWAAMLNVLSLSQPSILSGFWDALFAIWPALPLWAAFYIFKTARTGSGGIESIGKWILLSRKARDIPIAEARDQVVKAFFLPLMVSFAYSWSDKFSISDQMLPATWFSLSISILYLIDTVFGTVGYLSTSRRLDAHIRSSNPSWLGWSAALSCYPPIFVWLQSAGLRYGDGFTWSNWLSTSHPAYYLWALAILTLTGIYTLSTIAFGIRFSNLTNRGIITSGPYRFAKHPAYISKNISWWLISVPFIPSSGAMTAIWHCTALLAINLIYFIRARTEESHLSQDPAYQAYCAWISAHGLLPRLKLYLTPK